MVEYAVHSGHTWVVDLDRAVSKAAAGQSLQEMATTNGE